MKVLSHIEKDLKQIADMLLLNGTLTECPGLVHGKTGIAIFFFHYAEYTRNRLFSKYAIKVIKEMQNQIHVNSSADYEKGIAGIGVGVDYLIRNELLIARDDDICKELDHRMYRAVMYDPWQDVSLYDGLTGYGRYWMMRLRYPTPSVQARKCLLRMVGLIEEQLPDIPAKAQSDVYCFLHDLQQIFGFERCLNLFEECRRWGISSADKSRSFPRLGDSATGNIARMVQRNRYFNDALQDEMAVALQQIPEMDMEKAPSGMGLLNGYAGEGMLRLTALNQTNMSWMMLI